MDRYFTQPSVNSAHSTYILDRTIPCECEDEHNPTPGHGDCAKIVHIVQSGRGVDKIVAQWNKEDAA